MRALAEKIIPLPQLLYQPENQMNEGRLSAGEGSGIIPRLSQVPTSLVQMCQAIRRIVKTPTVMT
jgi:hypothetical protein